jgi:selenocysteine lyase/cysteine desulfurase
MTLNRRDFVASVGWSFLASTAARAAASTPAAPAIATDYSDWAAVRAEFDLSAEWLHFSQFYIVSHPRPVRAAIERYRRMLDANPFTTVEQGMGFEAFLGGAPEETRPQRVQRAAADYIGGRPEEVALTDSTTQGLALIYNGLTLKTDEEILTTTHDHYVHHEAMRLAAERSGASIRRVALYDAPAAASADEMAERLQRAIGSRTRIVGLTWVHSCSGVRLPVRRLTQVVADANRSRGEHERMLVVLDAVHGFGNQEEALAQLGCDFAAAGTHKWIFAPRGTGIIWAPLKNWGLLRPTIPTFYGPEPFTAWEEQQPPKPPTQAAWISPGGFKAYEHQWAMVEAFDFHRAIGRKRVAERIAALNTQCKEGLAGIAKVKVLTPRDPMLSAGITCFQVEGQTTEETVHRLLERKVIASSSPYKVSYPRLAPSLVNDEHQVEAALSAVRAIA